MYHALKDKVKDFHHKQPERFTNLIAGIKSGKEFTANKPSAETFSPLAAASTKEVNRYSPSGMQSIKYDLINPSKAELTASQYSNLYSGNIKLNKSNMISTFMEKSNPTQPHVSELYSKALQRDSNIFRKRGGEQTD